VEIEKIEGIREIVDSAIKGYGFRKEDRKRLGELIFDTFVVVMKVNREKIEKLVDKIEEEIEKQIQTSKSFQAEGKEEESAFHHGVAEGLEIAKGLIEETFRLRGVDSG